MVDCGVTFAKYSVFFFNLLFALTGIAVVTVGTLISTAYHHDHNFLVDELWSAPIILIVIGSIVFIIAFLGCCGAIKESLCLVLTFSLMLLVTILFEIGIGTVSYIHRGELKTVLDKGFNKTLQNYNINKEVWDMVQTEFKCCGADGPADYKTLNVTVLPNSCCPEFNKDTPTTCTEKDASKDGCKQKVFDLLNSKALIFAAVAIAVGLVQIIGFGYACCLYRSFRRNYEAV